jgi:Domain of unknown function (DUF1707)
MSTPDERARDKDRDAAIKLVEAARASGRIIEADRDKRVEELRRAQTLGEIQMLTNDLQSSAGTPAPAPLPVVAASTVEYGPAMSATTASAPTSTSTSATPTKFPKALLLVPLVIVLVVGISVVGGVVALVHGVNDGIDGIESSIPSYAPGDEPEKGDVNVLSVGGYADLVDAVREETGATVVFSAVLYPTYAVVELPVDASTQREKHYYWDGHELVDQDSKSTSTEERFDLRSVDPAVVVRLVQRVRRLADEPTSWYAVVRAPRDDRSMIWAHANNDFGESVYVGARRDGTIVYDSTEH